MHYDTRTPDYVLPSTVIPCNALARTQPTSLPLPRSLSPCLSLSLSLSHASLPCPSALGGCPRPLGCCLPLVSSSCCFLSVRLSASAGHFPSQVKTARCSELPLEARGGGGGGGSFCVTATHCLSRCFRYEAVCSPGLHSITSCEPAACRQFLYHINPAWAPPECVALTCVSLQIPGGTWLPASQPPSLPGGLSVSESYMHVV